MLHKRFYLLFLLVAFLLAACKKEPLTGVFQKLAGEWEYIGRGIFQGQKAFIEPYGIKHSIIFKVEGTYEVLRSDNKTEKGRIVSKYSDKYNNYIQLAPNISFTSKIVTKDSYSVSFYATAPEKLGLSGKFNICDGENDYSLIYMRK